MVPVKRIFSLLLFFVSTIIVSREFTPAYTKNDIEKIQKEIATPEYIADILPYDLSHCIALLHLAKEVGQDMVLYLRSVCKMYNNFVKQVAFLDAEMFVEFVHQFSFTIESLKKQKQQLLLKTTKQSHKAQLYEQLFGTFSAHYHQFKVDPEDFLHTLSDDLATMTFSHLDVVELEQTMVRFFEQAISKLLWDGQNHDHAWQTTKQIADALVSLSEAQIITDINNIDDLLWSLSTRYDYFLGLFSATLSAETALYIKKEIDTKKSSLFLFDTMHQVSKHALLTRTLNACLIQKTIVDQGTQSM
jgi:hypothetical protein